MRAEVRFTARYAVIQGVYWIIMAGFSVFIVPLLRARGFDSGQIGVLIAVRAFAFIGIQPLVAAFADRYAHKIPLKYIIAAVTGVGLLATAVFLGCRPGFWPTCAIFVLLGASINAMSPLYYALAAQYINDGYQLNFSLARGAGSATWACASILMGAMVDGWGAESILILQIAMLAISIAVVLSMRAGASAGIRPVRAGVTHSTMYLIRRVKGFGLFLLATMLLFIGSNMVMSFFVDIVARLHGANRDVGYAQFVLAVSELPIAFWYRHLAARLGTRRVMRLSAVFIFLKVLFSLLAPNIPLLIAVQVCQMLGGGIYWSSSLYYVNENVEEADKVKGQSLMAVASTGLGTGLGSVVSGVILQRFGLETLLICGAVCSGAGVFAMFGAMRRTAPPAAKNAARMPRAAHVNQSS